MHTVTITSPTLQSRSLSVVRFVMYLPIPMVMYMRSDAFPMPADAGQAQYPPMNFLGFQGFPGESAVAVIVQIIWAGCLHQSPKNFMGLSLKN